MKTILLLLLGFSLVACSHHGHKKAKWMKIDTDQDGKLSKAEFTKYYESKFSKMDSDNDGFITKEEKMKWKKSCRGNYCKRK